jgi:DNA-binding transcriptional LysR family regulator
VAPHRFITVGRLSGNRIILDAALADLPVRPRWFYEVQHLSTSLGLVETGLGVAAVPRLAVPTGEHPVLAVRPLVEPVVTRVMRIIRRHGATFSPAAQPFHNILRSRWGSE